MWFMMITSIILTAISLGQMVEPYTPGALVRAFWVVGLAALILGSLGLIRLEKRSEGGAPASEGYRWSEMFRAISQNQQARLFFWYLAILLAAILGQDILLEPFGGEAFGLSVQQTTRITSIWGMCVLVALVVAGGLEGRARKRTVAAVGGCGVLLGFLMILSSGLISNKEAFYMGVMFLGFGTGLSTVSNLSLMLDMTTAANVGLFIGAWGMANAVSRLAGTVLGGVVRDLVTQISQNPVTGYVVVFAIEALMIVVSLVMLRRIDVSQFQRDVEQPSLVERAAIATEA
jgi:BCD family chlorophyll transporter-like MFS transporter